MREQRSLGSKPPQEVSLVGPDPARCKAKTLAYYKQLLSQCVTFMQLASFICAAHSSFMLLNRIPDGQEVNQRLSQLRKRKTLLIGVLFTCTQMACSPGSTQEHALYRQTKTPVSLWFVILLTKKSPKQSVRYSKLISQSVSQ